MPEQVAVLIPSARRGPYDYRVPEGAAVARGTIVRVPLGARLVTGVVLGPGAGAIKPTKLKNIEAIIPWPREGEGGVQGDDAAPRGLDPHYLDFIEWVATYTMSDPAAVLRLGLPVDLGAPMPKTRATKKPVGGTAPDPGFHAVTLTSDQQDAARTLTDAVAARRYQTIVLDGVTGSGKTEVYAEAVAAALAQGRQVLVMLPEIALTQTIVARLAKRFGQAPALWHSGLTPAQRRNTYYAIITGRVRVVVGARSALMLPYDDLGLVVIDEEHDPAYKQEDGVLYHARDMAVARAHAAGFPVVLASATPSLETMANAWAGRYTVVRLPDRFGMAVMPEIHLIDLRVDKPASGTFLAPTLRTAIIQTIERGEQVLLFLNRRGYAPLTLCRACGHRFMCPRCTAWMVAHRRTGRLHCHHCGFEMSAPKACPACNTEGAMVACGPGVERIEEEVKTILPQARTLVLSSDLQTDPAQLEAALGQIEARAVDVVIGTQMIAKGHHFPGLTLVGVVDADLGLSGGDLRAAERTFQLLQQVAGRAGRAEKRGLVYLQSFMPDNKVMQALAAGKRDPFLRVEAAERQGASMPPYARLVAIIVSGRDEAAVRNHAAALGRAAPQGIGVKVWGPAEAPLFRIRGRVRMRLLVQADRGVAVQAMVSTWLASTPPPSNIDVRADVDPMGFL